LSKNLFATFVVLCLALSGPNLVSLVFGGVGTTRDDMYMKIAEKYIAESRMSDVRLLVTDAETGLPIPWSDVEYVQTSHDFVFTADRGTYSDAALQLGRTLGVEYVEPHFKWREIEPQKGVFDFGKSDDAIGYFVRRYPEARIWVWIFGIVPVDQSDYMSDRRFDPPEWSGWQKITTNATAFEGYKADVYDYVYNIVSRYKSIVHMWMTQNEINYLTRFTLYGNQTIPNARVGLLSQAVELDKATALAIRHADPDATILLGTSTAQGKSSSKFVDPFDFAKACLAGGVDFNAVALHVYPWNSWSPADYYDYFKKFATVGKRVFSHETGYPSSPPFASAPNWEEWKWNDVSEDAQAKWLNYTLALSFGSSNVMGYGYLQFQDAMTGSAYEREGWGLLRADGTPKKAYFVYQDAIRRYTSRGNGTTDAYGAFEFRAFAGNYSLNISAEGYQEKSTALHLGEGQSSNFTVTLVKLKAITTTVATPATTTTTSAATPNVPQAPIAYFAAGGMIVILVTAVVVARQRKSKRRQSVSVVSSEF